MGLYPHAGITALVLRSRVSLGMMLVDCNPNTWESEAGQLVKIQDQVGLHGKFQAS